MNLYISLVSCVIFCREYHKHIMCELPSPCIASFSLPRGLLTYYSGTLCTFPPQRSNTATTPGCPTTTHHSPPGLHATCLPKNLTPFPPISGILSCWCASSGRCGLVISYIICTFFCVLALTSSASAVFDASLAFELVLSGTEVSHRRPGVGADGTAVAERGLGSQAGRSVLRLRCDQ